MKSKLDQRLEEKCFEVDRKNSRRFIQSQRKPIRHRVSDSEYRNVDEDVVEKEIKDHLRSKGAWFVKFWPIGIVYGPGGTKNIIPNEKGTPDLLVCYKGFFFGIEAKNPKGTGTIDPLQQIQIERINRSGGCAFVTHSVEDCMMKINQYLETKGFRNE